MDCDSRFGFGNDGLLALELNEAFEVWRHH
jgi:hypothetical protein